MTSVQLSNKHIFLIVAAVGFIVLASTVVSLFVVYRGPSLGKLTEQQRKAMDERRKKQLPPNKGPVKSLSPQLLKWMNQVVNRPGSDVKSPEDLLIKACIDPEASDWRAQIMNFRTPDDYQYLVFAYANTIEFAEDKPEERLPVVDIPVPSNPGHLMDLQVKKTLYDASLHTSPANIEIAGRSDKTGSREIVTVHQHKSGHRLSVAFGEDATGVTSDGKIVVVSDGVSGTAGSNLAAQAAVDLTLELFEQHPDALLETHARGLIRAICKFIRFFNLPGKATFTALQYRRSLLGGGEVVVVNVGDTGAAIIGGPGSEPLVLAITPIGEHSPNQPHQIPSSVEVEATMAERVKVYRKTVASGCRVVVYSDGVSDNLWPKTVAGMRTAGDIAAAAAHVFLDGTITDVPISAHMGKSYKGKKDDVSCILITK